jgi:hypothetical protein
MKCPNCNETLLITERSHIEIDYCPACRGVWLDKGELDKMLDYAAYQSSSEKMEQQPGFSPNHFGRHNQYPHGHNKPYKKKSFLGDLFDFD